MAPNGIDGPMCGTSSTPCASVRYAVNQQAAAVLPLGAPVLVVLGPGRYTSASCGAVAGRPLSIVGAGSGSGGSLVDCEGNDRLLYTNSSVTLSGVAISNGHARVVVNASAPFEGQPVAGGGAVAVLWARNLTGAQLYVEDVAVTNCTVAVEVTGTGTQQAFVGGGAMLVAGGGDGASVQFSGCSFEGNSVSVTSINNVTGTSAAALPCGGALCLALGDVLAPGGGGEALSGVSVAFNQVFGAGNTLGCAVDQAGACAGWAQRRLPDEALCPVPCALCLPSSGVFFIGLCLACPCLLSPVQTPHSPRAAGRCSSVCAVGALA